MSRERNRLFIGEGSPFAFIFTLQLMSGRWPEWGSEAFYRRGREMVAAFEAHLSECGLNDTVNDARSAVDWLKTGGGVAFLARYTP